MIDFAELVARVEAGDVDEVATRLLEATEPDRRALAEPITEYRLPLLPFMASDTGDWMSRARQDDARRAWEFRRRSALAVAGAACLPRAAAVVSFLRSDRFQGWTAEAADAVTRVLQAPGRPPITAVAGAMARKMRHGSVGQWTLVDRLLLAAGMPVPPTEATLRGWMRETGFGWGDQDGLTDRLRADARTPDLVPHIFAIPRLGAELGDNGAPALAELAGDGGRDRRAILGGCLLRLRAGDRPGAIKPMTDLHRLLAPTVEECTAHRQEYLGMLSSPHIAVADLAVSALRTVDAAGLLEAEAIAEAGFAVLPRKEKKLVRAMLGWIGEVLSRAPDPAVYDALLVGLGNEATDLAEAALELAAVHLPRYGAEPLLNAAAGLDGDLRRQAHAVLGRAGATMEGVHDAASLPPMPPAAAMPPPIATIAELAGEVAAFRRWVDDPVPLERVLDALTRFTDEDRPALAAVLAPMVDGHTFHPIDDAVYAVVHRGRRPVHSHFLYTDSEPLPPLYRMRRARIAELARQLCDTPPPALLATPATVDGHVDPDRVLSLLTAAGTDGWQPGPYDLAQALLRLPRDVDPAVRAAAERLRFPAGRAFAGWLRAGGLPDPPVVALSVERRLCANHRNSNCWCLRPPRLRRTVAVEALPHPPLTVPAGLLHLAAGDSYHRAYGHWERYGTMAYWPMTLPGHRELVAAHMLPRLTTAADGVVANELDVLPSLAGCGGPFGPATALCLAYGLAAGRPAGRAATVDAFVLLASRGVLDGALVGRELGELQAAQVIVLKRVVDSLGEALRAGASTAVWDLARTLIPAVLDAESPGAGAADLLMVASSAASAARATGELPPVRSLASRGGRSRLVTEAARLIRTLDDNRAGHGSRQASGGRSTA